VPGQSRPIEAGIPPPKVSQLPHIEEPPSRNTRDVVAESMGTQTEHRLFSASQSSGKDGLPVEKSNLLELKGSSGNNASEPVSSRCLGSSMSCIISDCAWARKPVTPVPDIIVEKTTKGALELKSPVESPTESNLSELNASIPDEGVVDNSKSLVLYVPKPSSTRQTSSGPEYIFRPPQRDSENGSYIEADSFEFRRRRREQRRQRRQERRPDFDSPAGQTTTNEGVRSLVSTELSSEVPRLKFGGRFSRFTSLFSSLFREKQMTFDASFSAYIIKYREGHQVPHSGRLRLTKQQIKNLESQPSKQSWYKLFAFLEDDDRDALKPILSSGWRDNDEVVVKRRIIYLGKVKEDRLKFCKAKIEALFAIVADMLPEVPSVGDLEEPASSLVTLQTYRKGTGRQESPVLTAEHEISMNMGFNFPPEVQLPAPLPRPFQNVPGPPLPPPPGISIPGRMPPPRANQISVVLSVCHVLHRHQYKLQQSPGISHLRQL
jgi:hypothetical protein